MEITLNHTIVPSFDNVKTAKFYEKLFGFEYIKEWGHFAVLKVNSTLTLDFTTKENFPSSHFAFKVSESDFDIIFERIKSSDLSYGSDPMNQDNGEINHLDGGRGVYFKDINGHVLEIITRDYDLDRED